MIEMTNTINGVQYLQEDGILYISHTGNCYRRASYSEICQLPHAKAVGLALSSKVDNPEYKEYLYEESKKLLKELFEIEERQTKGE